MAAFIRLLWIQFDLYMMVIHVDLELQQSIDLFLPGVGCIFKVLTEPGSITES
jgi:hypothetical protein